MNPPSEPGKTKPIKANFHEGAKMNDNFFAEKGL